MLWSFHQRDHSRRIYFVSAIPPADYDANRAGSPTIGGLAVRGLESLVPGGLPCGKSVNIHSIKQSSPRSSDQANTGYTSVFPRTVTRAGTGYISVFPRNCDWGRHRGYICVQAVTRASIAYLRLLISVERPSPRPEPCRPTFPLTISDHRGRAARFRNHTHHETAQTYSRLYSLPHF